jgi:hypothetical protein
MNDKTSLKVSCAVLITVVYALRFSEIFLSVSRVIIVLTAVMELQRLLIAKAS